MKARLWIARTACALVAVAALPALASVQSGDIIKLSHVVGGPGGIFLATEPADGTTVPFGTFCVQLEEHINYNTPYRVFSITDHTLTGNNPLGDQTAWLYTQFTDQNASATGLAGFNFAAPTADQANALQLGIWQGMNYLNAAIQSGAGWSAAYVNFLETNFLDGWLDAFDDSNWTGTGEVWIMNLVSPTNDAVHHQDQLIRIPGNPPPPDGAPEPATLVVWGGLAVAAGLVRRKRSAG